LIIAAGEVRDMSVNLRSEQKFANTGSTFRFLNHKYRQVTSWSQMKSGRLFNLPQIIYSGEPSRARTCDPLIKRAVTSTASDYGSYDLLTFVTGCSRLGVHLLLPITATFAVVLSQVCLNR